MVDIGFSSEAVAAAGEVGSENPFSMAHQNTKTAVQICDFIGGEKNNNNKKKPDTTRTHRTLLLLPL